jgi:hypothetical protein
MPSHHLRTSARNIQHLGLVVLLASLTWAKHTSAADLPNHPPVAALISMPGSSFFTGEVSRWRAEVFDPDGRVAQVEFQKIEQAWDGLGIVVVTNSIGTATNWSSPGPIGLLAIGPG